MHTIDWIIVLVFFSFITIVAFVCRKYTRSVSDFLAANRCAGRYVLGIAEGEAGLGAITILAMFEMYYEAGFTMNWWLLFRAPIYIIVALSGWVIYRFRQTRAMTMAQFFEIRYNKNFRVFTGLLGFLSGVLNFAIFPAVAGRFFIYFCNIPQHITIAGVSVSTYPLLMAVIISLALFFTFIGGQIVIIVTDFIQGVFTNLIFIILLIFIFLKFNWSQISSALATAPKEASLVHPFHTGDIRTFNIWFVLIAAFGFVYTYMAWQGNQGFNCSAKSAHEARMGKIMGSLRSWVQSLLYLFVPIAAYTLMHHPDFALQAGQVKSVLENISNEYIRKQMTVPIAVAQVLPRGLYGAVCAMMLAAFISNAGSYLHSWGSIFIQDAVLPLKKTAFTPRQHILFLRLSICSVAVFIFLFSWVFKQTQYILLYFAITGTIYMAGAGAVIIGGLYWKRGTTAAAWVSMISGAILAVAGLIIYQIDPTFPINAQVMWFIGMISSIVIYIAVSLLGKKTIFDLDKMLHRDKQLSENPRENLLGKMLERLGITKEFSFMDKVVYFFLLFWTLGWFLIFIIGSIYNLTHEVSVDGWLSFWKFQACLIFVLGTIFLIWLTIGGFYDLQFMFTSLKAIKRNDRDDGRVLKNELSFTESDNEQEHKSKEQ